MKKRSDCPLNAALEIFGDKWTLLIIRDILFYDKMNFKDLIQSSEGISTNILSRRLKMLQDAGILEKQSSSTSKRMIDYSLTQKGKDLKPVLLVISSWSEKHIADVTKLIISENNCTELIL